MRAKHQSTEHRVQSTENLFFVLCLLSSVFCYLLSANFVFAEEEKSKVPVVVNGDKVEYFQDEQKVVGTGDVVVTYEDVKLTCDKMTVYLDTKDAFAEGDVKIYQEDNVFYGEKGTYNFETKKGTIIKADMDAPPWYGKGKELEKLGAKEYRVEKGFITSCDYSPSHYKIQSKKVKIFLDDKVTAEHCLMYVGNYPILYLPYYAHPLNEDRPRVTVLPGYDSNWGAFVLTKWRYYLNEYMRGTVHLDYRERRDFAWGVDYKYDTRYIGDGLLRTYYMHERTLQTKRLWKKIDEQQDEIKPTVELERYKIQLRHKWEVDENTDIKAEYHKFSDTTINKEYFFREEYERDEATPTYASLITQKPLFSGEFTVTKRANHHDTEVERLPEVKLNIGSNKFLNTNFYYKSENAFSNLDKKFAEDTSEDLDVVRYDSYDEVSYLTQMLGFLSLKPYAGVRETYYTKDKWGNPDWFRTVFSTGIDTSTRFYKIFPYSTNILGLDIHGLRHVVNPVVKYTYSHDPTIPSGNLMEFDDIDRKERENKISFDFENKLQTRRMVKEETEGKKTEEMKTIDLARLIVSTSYSFKMEQGSEFANIGTTLELRPYGWLYTQGNISYNHQADKVDTGTWDLVAEDPTGKQDWRVGLGYRYEVGNTSQLTAEVACKLTPKWKIRIYERYEGNKNDLKEHEYSIIRDLHCWTAELTYNIYRQAGETLWIIFRTKAFPRSPFIVDTSYHQPKTRSQTFYPLP